MSNTAQVIELVSPPSWSERLNRQPPISADEALAGIRAKFGRNSAASRWSRLSKKERAIVCFAADIPPDQGQHMELEQFEVEQQEALRAALVLMQSISKKFDGPVLGYREWHHTSRRTAPRPKREPIAPVDAPPEPVSRDDLLAKRKALLKKISGQSGQHPEPQALYDEE